MKDVKYQASCSLLSESVIWTLHWQITLMMNCTAQSAAHTCILKN